MENKIIMAGFGGQGVLSIGKFLAYAGMEENLEVTWMPSYGPEMRGGTANCSVVMSDRPVGSPVIATADCLIVMNKPSVAKFIGMVKKDGVVLVNSSLIEDKIERTDVKVYYIPANELAHKAGSDRSANVTMFGACVAATKAIAKESALKVINKQFGKKPAVLESALKAFEAGFEAASK